MKRYLLLTLLLPFLLIACNENGDLGVPAGEEDYPIEIANGDRSEPDSAIINGTKTDGALEAIDDIDGDLIPDSEDNCPTVSNPYQEDVNDDGLGDACEELD